MISSLESETALDKAFKGTDYVVLQPFGHQVSRQGQWRELFFTHVLLGGRPLVVDEIRPQNDM